MTVSLRDCTCGQPAEQKDWHDPTCRYRTYPTALDRILESRGFTPRSQQVSLFEHLVKADHRGVISQAGTGVGKSLAILAAATHLNRVNGQQSIIVTPTLALMDQYVDKDLPAAREAFPGVAYCELRGADHYHCDMTASLYIGGEEYPGGCMGQDAGCSNLAWVENDYRCDYREARAAAQDADVVVTNTAMLMVNDFILATIASENPVNPLSVDENSALFVDEAHMLEPKIRDWYARSMWHMDLKRYQSGIDEVNASAYDLGCWIEKQKDGPWDPVASPIPRDDLDRIVDNLPVVKPSKKMEQVRDAAARLRMNIEEPDPSVVMYFEDGSLRTERINVGLAAERILTRRRFGLVSATVPKTMAATLGVPEAPFVDVGHPFNYASQAWIGFSGHSGAYRDAQNDWNFDLRVQEVEDLIRRSKGGVLLLFSAFTDLDRVHERLRPTLREMGLTVLKQEPGVDKAELARIFKEDGNAVLFGSETFATGFDAPGSALRCVVIWKLPYPPRSAANDAIMKQNMARYQDMMTVRAVQGIGRLIRSDEDRGIVWIADSRATRLLNPIDPLTSHLVEFNRL